MPVLSNRIRPIGWLLGILCLAAHPALADEQVPPGPFTETECITCHTERDPDLIRQWRESTHSTASGVGCSSCHGDRHKDSGIKARKDQSCTGCHEGPASLEIGWLLVELPVLVEQTGQFVQMFNICSKNVHFVSLDLADWLH